MKNYFLRKKSIEASKNPATEIVVSITAISPSNSSSYDSSSSLYQDIRPTCNSNECYNGINTHTLPLSITLTLNSKKVKRKLHKVNRAFSPLEIGII
jgi:hypothetical protein